MRPNLLIRPATQDDARGIAEVHVASWKAAYTQLLPNEKLAQLDVDHRERRWRDILDGAEAAELRAWVAIVNDATVGFVVTQPSMDEDLERSVHELSALYLVPNVWRAGIGSALLEKAVHELRQAGVPEVALWVLEANDGAITFYKTRGWSFDKRDPSFKDFGAAAVRYRKKL